MSMPRLLASVFVVGLMTSGATAGDWIETAGLSAATGVEADALRGSLREMYPYIIEEYENQAYAPAEIAWICEALSRAGLYGETEALLRRAVDHVRGDDAMPLPRGSLPAKIAGAHAEPPSPLVFDAEGGAWLLAALWRYVETRPKRAGVAFAARDWSTLVAMGDFLAGWRPGYDPEPLYTHLHVEGHSGLKPQMIFSFYLGLSSAEKLSEVMGRRAPASWAVRIRSLGALVKSRALDRENVVPLDAPFASYLNRIDPVLGDEAPVTVRVGGEEQFLDAVPRLPPLTWIAHPACNAALQFLRVSDTLY